MLLFRSRFPGFSPFSRPGFPCLVPVVCTRLSVSFLSPFLASLPQLFRKCLPGSVRLSVHFPLAFVPFSAFFRPLVFGLWLLSLCFFRSPLPGFPSQWFFPVLLSVFRLLLSASSSSCFQVSVSASGTWLSCNSFSRFLHLPYRCFRSFRPPLSSTVAPIAFALGSGT